MSTGSGFRPVTDPAALHAASYTLLQPLIAVSALPFSGGNLRAVTEPAALADLTATMAVAIGGGDLAIVAASADLAAALSAGARPNGEASHG